MTLQAKKRLTCNQKVIINRTMRAMTVQAGIDNVGMLKDKRSALFRMTLNAGLFNGVFPQVFIGKTAMGIVTTGTGYSAFIQRMMAGQGKFHL